MSASKTAKRRCWVILLCTGLLLHASAQDREPIRMYFVQDSIPISPGHTFSNQLQLTNTTAKPLRLSLDPLTTSQESNYLPLPQLLLLQPGETRRLPVKYLASAGLIQRAVQRFYAAYQTADGQTLSASFFTMINTAPAIAITLASPTVYLDPATNEARAGLFLANEGYLQQNLNLRLTSYPDGLTIEGYQQPLSLSAGARHFFSFAMHSRLKENFSSDFNVLVQVFTDSGQIVASSNFQVQILSSSKQLGSPYLFMGNPLNNTVELNYIHMSHYYSYLQFRGGGGIPLSEKSRLAYNMNLEYYPNFRGFNAYDTWAGIRTAHFGFRAGNLTDNLDYPLVGRGIQATLTPDTHNSFDIFALQNNYLLFSQVLKQLDGAKIIAGRYRYGTKPNRTMELSFLHGRDPILGVNANLLHAKGQFNLTAHQDLQLETGISQESALDHSTNHGGLALGEIYHGEFPRWSLSLQNYYSSPYYSGYRRGVTQLEDQLAFKASADSRLWLRYSRVDNAPKYEHQFDSIPLAQFNYNNIDMYEAGYRWRMGHWFSALRPYYMTQSLYTAFPMHPIILRSRSDRLALDLTYGSHRQSLYLSGDFGLTSSDSAQGPTFHYSSLRLTGNYFSGAWGLNLQFQNHPYYLTDQIQSSDPHRYQLYALGPVAHLQALDERLSINGYYNLNYYRYYDDAGTWAHSLDIQASYALRDNWQLNGQVYYNLYRSPLGDWQPNTMIRVGVRKTFLQTTQPGSIRLHLLLFHDANANGRLDTGETSAEGVIIRIDDQVAVTNSRGKATYSNMPRGAHTIIVEDGSDWILLSPLTVLLQRTSTLTIPLVQSGSLNGQILIVRHKYEHVEPDPEGIKIRATNAYGISYTTITDEHGAFHLYLPVGKYMITVPGWETAANGQQAEQGQAEQGQASSQDRTAKNWQVTKEIEIAPGKETPLQFKLADHRRRIQVQQF